MLTWDDLFIAGSVIDLRTRKWRARAALTPRDLGIEDTDAVSQALALGAHRLAPNDAFGRVNEIHARARRAVESASVNFSLIVGARYVPEANIAGLAAQLRDCKESFRIAVNDFMASYEEVKRAMLPVLHQALRDAAKTPDAALAAYDRLVAEYPSASEVREKFELAWNIYAIKGPKKEGAQASLQSEAEEVRSAVREMIKELREDVRLKLAEVLALIAKGGKLQTRSIQSAMTVLDHIDRTNVFGDEDLRRQVAGLRAALREINTDEDVPETTIAGLESVRTALAQNIEEAVAAAEQKLTGVGRRKLVAV
jgi:hypothetical protein